MDKINVAVASEEELRPDDLLARMIRDDGSLLLVGTVADMEDVERLMKLNPPDVILFRSIIPKLWNRNGRLFTGAQNIGGANYTIPGSATPLREENLELMVSNIFYELGIPAHVNGFHFLRDAVILAVYDSGMIGKMTKVLYPTIARKHSTTSTRVERGIRHAIDIAWERGNMARINDIFGSTILEKRAKPTNAEFIAMISDKIRLDWKNRKY